MKFKSLILVAAVAAFSLSSCKSSYHGVKNEHTYLELKKEDIQLSERVEASAKQVKVLGIDWARVAKKEGGSFDQNGYVSVVGGGFVPNKVQNYALHNLLLKNPDYDFVMYPRFQVQSTKVLIFFKKTEIKVTARLGKL